ncbi:hypothetical protein HNQ60_000552 [Povalibacter uvarum]|uniref:MobA/VirD2-like nuclease domain-containing protein n=1 Tax=Povalibacter uvarum TaxID=732238 RepID=A0A841HG09_9GAMM|nr:relaxase/mobilization nuclease domain-containing protein [Povalibacter uvarum]MBB6091706.1 hypothetical protein [Povalibacter uvarum]
MRPFRLEQGPSLLNIVSHGRHGPGTMHLTPAHIEQIRRTVGYAPEVMVKVTGGAGGCSRQGVIAHFNYIDRKGELEIETDEGPARLKGVGAQLFNRWDLDLEEHRKRADLSAIQRRKPPKLVHRLVFSMPAGTPPKKVLSAVRSFAREEFGLKHRYAMVLHTDEPHPHVHVVVKAVSEEGVRLNIRKETLRSWRNEFARHLRAQGVEANATERAVRGESGRTLKDGMYRAMQRRVSTVLSREVQDATRHMPKSPGEESLLETRRSVESGWCAAAGLLERNGDRILAESVRRFVATMQPPRTERGWPTKPAERALTREQERTR